MSDIRNHQRVNDILLGPLERPALKWLAAHMPARGDAGHDDNDRRGGGGSDVYWLCTEQPRPEFSMVGDAWLRDQLVR